MSRVLEFPVTIGLGKGDGGDVSVSMEVSDEEFDLLVDTYLEGDGIDDCDDLEDLYDRIVAAAGDECDWSYGDDDESSLDEAYYFVSYPDEVIEEADESEDDDFDDESLLKDIDDITEDDLIDVNDLVHAFEEYLIKNRGYTKGEAELAASDLKDPYNTPYIYQEYEGDAEIGGVDYEVRSCKTNFAMCGLFELASMKPFEFYMLIDTSTMEDQTVGSYTKAEKKYVI